MNIEEVARIVARNNSGAWLCGNVDIISYITKSATYVVQRPHKILCQYSTTVLCYNRQCPLPSAYIKTVKQVAKVVGRSPRTNARILNETIPNLVTSREMRKYQCSLASTLSFTGSWVNNFSLEAGENFLDNNNQQTLVLMMSCIGEISYIATDALLAVRLSFQDGSIGEFVCGSNDFVALDHAQWNKGYVKVKLPVFAAQSRVNLLPIHEEIFGSCPCVGSEASAPLTVMTQLVQVNLGPSETRRKKSSTETKIAETLVFNRTFYYRIHNHGIILMHGCYNGD